MATINHQNEREKKTSHGVNRNYRSAICPKLLNTKRHIFTHVTTM